MKNNSGSGGAVVDINLSAVTDDTAVLTEKLKNLAGFLDLPSEAADQLEELVLEGLNIFISALLTQRILKVTSSVVDNKVVEEKNKIDQYVNSNADVGLLHSFFAVVTNYSSHHRCAESFLKYKGLFEDMSKVWFDPKYKVVLPFSFKSLHNLSTAGSIRDKLLQLHPSVLTLCVQTIKDIDDPSYVLPLVTFISNMTATREARRLLLKSTETGAFEEIFKCLDPECPEELRLMASRFVKHMTADEVSHWYLLQEEVNILPVILLPLAGNEVFDDEDYSKMPLELQYLDSEKTREENIEIRENLLFALLQLCRLKKCREHIRDSNSYYILRELHKFETQDSMMDLVEKVVDLLIRTEAEIGEKGDFVDFEIPSLEKWLNGDFVYPPE